MMQVLMALILVAYPLGATRAEDVPRDIAPEIASDVAAGAIAFKKCLACHAVGPGARNKFGPQLNGLDGRLSGTATGYKYSAAYRNARIVWNETTFVEYIKDPKWMIPGAKMNFRGIKDEDEAMALWAYISQFNADGTKD
jgi:cytochrome c